MAQVVFSTIGSAIGSHVLPQGVSLLGQQIAGAAIGRAVGSLAGAWVDASLAGAAEGPRVEDLHVMGAREGAGVPAVYGRARVGGQVIWASRFREEKTTERAGGKGGPRVTDYSYSVSFAVALGEGEIHKIGLVWANGEPFDLSGAVWRLYEGRDDQQSDPLIEMIEGDAPAYRGTAYIVFEDFPLEAFGNRLPQLSFEVERRPQVDVYALADAVTAVNIIPASGEFVYATEIVRDVIRPGAEVAINANSGEARADFLVSLDQLQADLPRVKAAALTVGWFGDDVAAGTCRIRPGVTRAERRTTRDWSVAGVGRADAYVVSQDADGRANYGGTPADFCVVQAIAELNLRGIAVTVSPFLFMDSPGFPWRGRIGVSADGSAAARAEIETFMAGPFGYRAFILHHAELAKEAGGVEAFLIGSEMIGLTRVRDGAGAFPFVEALCALAAEVKLMLPGVKVSYAADWTEYGAFVPHDGSGDVLFPLDALWGHEAVDFIGIDWYPPTGDWREGETHLDTLAGYVGPDDVDYLASQIVGGEAHDYFYADDEARAVQARSPITDGAYGEPWIYRAKDLPSWAAHPHFERVGGVRNALPTAFVPGGKPVRLSEIGFGAVDKGGNAPNLFVDPKSDESGLPPFSTGARDDVFQKAALSAALAHWEASGVVEAAHVWAWDGRPFPAFPLRGDVWGDGDNWARGHWLNGRAGLTRLGDVVADICARGGAVDVETGGLDGVVEGFVLNGVSSVRAALETLKGAFGFDTVEGAGGVEFQMEGEGRLWDWRASDLVEGGLEVTRRLMDKAPERVRLTYINPEADYAPGVAEARNEGGDPRLVMDVSAALVMNGARADGVARHVLNRAQVNVTGEARVSLDGASLKAGDRLRIDGGVIWRITRIEDEGLERRLSLAADVAVPARVRAGGVGALAPVVDVAGEVDLVVMDAPLMPGEAGGGALVAAWADPWPGEVTVLAGVGAETMTRRAALTRPAVIGRLLANVDAGPVGRWDRAGEIIVETPRSFLSRSEVDVLNGANAALLETGTGWELIQFVEAELIGPQVWRLSKLLRGQQGSLSGAAMAGARLVLIDGATERARVAPGEIGLPLEWRAETGQATQDETFMDAGHLPWPVAHLRLENGMAHWVRRGAEVPDSWALPDAPNEGVFVVEVDEGSGFGGPQTVHEPVATVGENVLAARVAERNSAGRLGPWVSISGETP